MIAVSIAAQAAPSSTLPPAKVESVFRNDLNGTSRYEANLFNGKVPDDSGAPIVMGSGGLGLLDASNETFDLSYAGGTLKAPTFNDATIIYNTSSGFRSEDDYQGKVKLFGPISVAGGYTRSRMNGVADSNFYTLWHTLSLGDNGTEGSPLTLLTRAGYVDWEGTASGEGSLVLSDKYGSIGGNYNKEQWRFGAGYAVPKGMAGEVLVLDNDIGKPGANGFMVNWALRSSHPFFSNPARESRILGVDSVSFQNPILRGSTFLDPYLFTNYNRLQYLQDVGDGIVMRARGFSFPNDSKVLFSELLFFPFQLAGSCGDSVLNGFFVGPAYDWSQDVKNASADLFGAAAGVRAIPLWRSLNLNFSYRNVGMFQSDSQGKQDLLVYLSGLL
jgi:hypothetical protein